VLHDGYTENQIEAFIFVRKQQVWSKLIETLLREICARSSDHVFAAVDSGESGPRGIEARGPATDAGANVQNIERIVGGAPSSCGNEPWPEHFGLRAVHGFGGSRVTGQAGDRSVRRRIRWRMSTCLRILVRSVPTAAEDARGCGLCFEYGTKARGHLAWVVGFGSDALLFCPEVPPAQALPDILIRGHDAIEELESF
jgi:hypothetical protein